MFDLRVCYCVHNIDIVGVAMVAAPTIYSTHMYHYFPAHLSQPFYYYQQQHHLQHNYQHNQHHHHHPAAFIRVNAANKLHGGESNESL